MDLTKLIALLSSKVRVVLPARLQYRFLHELQIEAMKRENSYLARVNKALFSTRRIPLADRESEALQWEKRKTVRTTISDTNRCITEKLGAHCDGISTEGMRSQKKQNYHINVLELLAAKIAIFTFRKDKLSISIHL